MQQIRINIQNLQEHRIRLQVKQAAHRSKCSEIAEISYSGTGKMAGELTWVDAACRQLNHELDCVYSGLDNFLQCAEDGVITTEELTVGMIQGQESQ